MTSLETPVLLSYVCSGKIGGPKWGPGPPLATSITTGPFFEPSVMERKIILLLVCLSLSDNCIILRRICR